MNIFVTKLNRNTKEDHLKELFEEYGEVSSAKIVTDRDTGRSKCFGFVEMPDDEAAKQAINSLNETDFMDFQIVVKEAQPREDRPRNDRPRRDFRDRNDRNDRNDRGLSLIHI